MKNPKVSIIIPVYNGANFLSEAIESALNQTYSNFEVIVVNDGSCDNGATRKVAQSFGGKIRYYEKKNGGVASALNFGIKKMKGEYFSWLSHDDLYFPEKLEKQISFFKKRPKNTIVYGNFVVIDQYGRLDKEVKIQPPSKSKFIYAIMTDRFIHGCTLLIHKSAFEKAGLFNENLKNTQDYELWFRLICQGFNFVHQNESLVKARHHAKQTSLLTNDVQIKEEDNLYYWVINKFLPKQLFPKTKNLSLDYLKLSLFLKIQGCIKASQLAKNLSFRYLAVRYYLTFFLYYLYYLLWPKNLINFLQFLSQHFRQLKRKSFKISAVDKRDNQRFKICFIGNASSIHNQKLIDFLRGQNCYDIHFISTHKGRIFGIRNYDLSRRRFEPKFWWFLRAILSSRKLIQKINPHLVQGQYLAHGGIFAYLSGFRPYIAGIWGTEVLEFEQFGILKFLIKKTLLNAEKIVGSSFVLRDAAVLLGADPVKFQLVRFGIDLNVFKPASSDYLCQKLGLKDEKVIFSPRAIDVIYNTKVLVQAFEVIVQKEDFKLALLNQPFNQSYFQEIKKYINNHQLEDKVIFLPMVENSKMADYYNLAEVVVTISRSDSAAVSFLEAMACEKKIVVSDLPFLKEWQKGHNFWRSKIKVNVLSKTLIQALNYSADKFRPVGRANRKLVRQKADLKTCFDELDSLYRNFL